MGNIMADDKISVVLSDFEKLAILREQYEEREEELRKLEVEIRTGKEKLARQRYLESLSPYYAMNNEGLPKLEEIQKKEERRRVIKELLTTLDKEIPEMLNRAQSGEGADSGEEVQAQQRDGVARKASFDF
jgi:hypothetical protein